MQCSEIFTVFFSARIYTKNFKLPESVRNACLFQNVIRSVAGLDFAVYRYFAIRDRAEPNIMVSFSVPLEKTSVFHQDFTDFPLVFSHLSIPCPACPQ